jgi:hypothetical protein
MANMHRTRYKIEKEFQKASKQNGKLYRIGKEIPP